MVLNDIARDVLICQTSQTEVAKGNRHMFKRWTGKESRPFKLTTPQRGS